MQCTEYSKIWLHLTFVALSLTFIRGHKAFLEFHADRVFIGLPCGQGQPSRIWKVQCDWLRLGKECCSRLSRRLWGGTKYELPLKRLHGRLLVSQSVFLTLLNAKAPHRVLRQWFMFLKNRWLYTLAKSACVTKVFQQKGRSVEWKGTWPSHRNNETLLFAEVSTFVIVRNKVEEHHDHGY